MNRYLVALLLLAGCDALPVPPAEPVEGTMTPNSPTTSFAFSAIAGEEQIVCTWAFSPGSGAATVSGNFRRMVRGTVTVTMRPPDGYTISQWVLNGDPRQGSPSIVISSSQIRGSLVAVLAPSGNG